MTGATLTGIVKAGVAESDGLNENEPMRQIHIVVNRGLHGAFATECTRRGWTQRAVIAALVSAFVADAQAEGGDA